MGDVIDEYINTCEKQKNDEMCNNDAENTQRKMAIQKWYEIKEDIDNDLEATATSMQALRDRVWSFCADKTNQGISWCVTSFFSSRMFLGLRFNTNIILGGLNPTAGLQFGFGFVWNSELNPNFLGTPTWNISSNTLGSIPLVKECPLNDCTPFGKFEVFPHNILTNGYSFGDLTPNVALTIKDEWPLVINGPHAPGFCGDGKHNCSAVGDSQYTPDYRLSTDN